MRRVRVVYTGRVQGVGFRATSRSLAQGFGVTGWVRNDPGGTVTMEAQAESTQIDALLDAIQNRLGRGISGASVTDIELDSSDDGFRIAH